MTVFRLHIQKNGLLLLFLFFAACPFWSQSNTARIYAGIDAAILAENTVQVQEILSRQQNTSFYTDVETYVMKSARDLIVSDKLDLAQSVTLAVLDVNLDNYEAAALYISIEKAIAKRNAQLKAAADKQLLAEMKQAAATEKAKAEIKKEYKTVTNLQSGETIYLDQSANSHFNPLEWMIFMGPVAGAVTERSDSIANSNSIKTGLSFGGSTVYRGTWFSAGVSIATDYFIQSITDPQNFISSCKIIGLFSFKKAAPHVFWRLGYGGIFTQLEKTNGVTVSDSVIPTPAFNGILAGIGLRNIKLGSVLFDAAIDYNFGAQLTSDLLAAGEMNINFTFPLMDLDTLDINLNCGIADSFILASDGFQNQAKFIMTIGVGNND